MSLLEEQIIATCFGIKVALFTSDLGSNVSLITIIYIVVWYIAMFYSSSIVGCQEMEEAWEGQDESTFQCFNFNINKHIKKSVLCFLF